MGTGFVTTICCDLSLRKSRPQDGATPAEWQQRGEGYLRREGTDVCTWPRHKAHFFPGCQLPGGVLLCTSILSPVSRGAGARAWHSGQSICVRSHYCPFLSGHFEGTVRRSAVKAQLSPVSPLPQPGIPMETRAPKPSPPQSLGLCLCPRWCRRSRRSRNRLGYRR